MVYSGLIFGVLHRGSNRASVGTISNANDASSPAKKTARKRKLGASISKQKSVFDDEDDFSIPGSIQYQYENPSKQPQHRGMASLYTSKTAEISSMSQGGLPEPSSQVVFDFDPEVSLDLGLSKGYERHHQFQQGLKNYNYYRMQGELSDIQLQTFPTNERVQHKRNHEYPSHPDGANHNPKWDVCYDDDEDGDETHNHFIARRFNRQRIERHLDFLCPPDCDDSIHQYVSNLHKIFPRQEKRIPNKEVESHKVILNTPSSFSEAIKDLTMPLSSKEQQDALNETNNEAEKNNDDYSLKEGINDSIYKYSSDLYKSPSIYALYGSVPSLINIPESNYDDGDYSTIADSVTEDDYLVLPQNKQETMITTAQQNQADGFKLNAIEQSNSYDTNQSPKGVERFEFGTFDNRKASERVSLGSPTGTMMSVSSPITYSSANILKIKSRMRKIESEYKHMKTCLVGI